MVEINPWCQTCFTNKRFNENYQSSSILKSLIDRQSAYHILTFGIMENINLQLIKTNHIDGNKPWEK